MFPDVPSISYTALRPSILSGDLLLCSGSAPFSRLIQAATDSVWSHVAFVLRIDTIDRVMVLESVESIGVRVIPLSLYVDDYNGTGKSYPGRLFLARHGGLSLLSPDRLAQLSQGAVDLLGYPYDIQAIVSIALRIASTKLGIVHSPLVSERAYICSEYVARCYMSIGVKISGAYSFIAPKDFASCDAVTFLSEITPERLS